MLGVYILAVSAAACVVVGLFVISRGLRDRKILIYALLTLSLLVLCIMNHLAVSMPTDQILYVRGVMASTTVSMYLIYLLIKNLTIRKHQTPFYRTKLFYATVAMFILDFTDLLFSGVIPGEPPTPIPNFGIIFFFGLYITTLIMGIWQLRADMSRAQSVNERRRYALLIAGIIPIVLLAPLTSFVLPNVFGVNQFVVATPLYAFIFTSLVGYAIVRHGLFDIRLATVRTIAYALSLLSLAGIYYVIAYVVSLTFFKGETTAEVSLGPVNILLAIILSFIFQPIKRFFDRATNRIFYKDNYKSEDFFTQLSNVLTSTINLRGLLERASKEIATTFKAEQVSFFLYYTNGSSHHTSAGTQGHSKLPIHDAYLLDKFAERDELRIYIRDLMPDDDPVKRMLYSHKIALVMPLRHAGTITGYVLLGDRKSGNYTKRDLNVLLTVSNELVIAIQNALSLHEIKELNATLQQRIDVATKELRSSNAQLKHLDEVKDEFMSMASHQLRTPLTSVKGYLSMVLDGDVGEVSPQQGKLLTEAYNSSERMVRLIADFLNVSRLQTGRFILERHPVDLQDIVHHEVESLKLIASSHNVNLKGDIMRSPAVVRIDAAKIQQVIMNLIDNAIYYSPASSTITISLQKDAENRIEFRVIDQGIGVPVADQSKLFTRFFRAKNARKQRPDGTGVGLYLAKKVVTAHGGTMIFDSIEGQGSTFGFRLPAPRLDEDADNTDDQDNQQ